MTVNYHDVGDTARLPTMITNAAGSAVDPSQLALRVWNPNQAMTVYTYGGTPAVSASGTAGSYYVDLMLDQPGRWVYRWEGTGGNSAAEQGEFRVRRPGVW